MAEQGDRKIGDVVVGERVAVRVRGEWQRWAKVVRVTATQIVTTGPSEAVKESRWRRDTGREVGHKVGGYHWVDIALPTPRDEAWAARQVALARIERALRAVRGHQDHQWVQAPAEVRAALTQMGVEARRLCEALEKHREGQV